MSGMGDGVSSFCLVGPSLCDALLKGSWDVVAELINKVTIVIITYNPN